MLRTPAFALLLLALLAPMAQAKVYYFNKGVKYHIGDGHYDASEDAQFLDSFPMVGPQWVQAFTVDKPDVVKVRIDQIWAVDDCAYCKDMIYIDDHAMGRLFEENNHAPFNTPTPLSMRVYPGHVYVLKIVSLGQPGPIDDFAVAGVSVETDADVIPIGEPQLGPVGPVHIKPNTPVEIPCEGTQLLSDWLPPGSKSRGMIPWSPGPVPVMRRMGKGLAAGEFARVFVRVTRTAQGAALDQFFEVQLGDPGTGWILNFAPGAVKPFSGNIKVNGDYRATHFSAGDWNIGGWNELKVARCPGGWARLWINGQDSGAPLRDEGASDSFRLRGSGLKAEVADHAY